MNTAAYIIVTVLIASASYFGIKWLIRAYSRYRGTKIVTCPETGRPAVVEVDALHASLTSTVGPPDIRLNDCWRWPLQERCGQECLTDLDVAPGQCLVSGVLMRWYRDKNCFYCRQAFSEVQWLDHQPALLTPGGVLLSWKDVKVNDLRTVLATHSPVCWNCYIAQSFRVDHPDLVVYRPWRNDINGDVDGSFASRRHL